MKKYRTIALGLSLVIIIIILAYYLKVDYWILKSRYMADELYCEHDNECRYFSVGCGGCDNKLKNIFAGENRFKKKNSCGWTTTGCYWGPHISSCEGNKCIGYSVDEDCLRECLPENFREIRNNDFKKYLEIYKNCTYVCVKH